MPNEDRYLVAVAKRRRQCTSYYLSRQLSAAPATIVPTQTVSKHLGHVGLYSRCLQLDSPLTFIWITSVTRYQQDNITERYRFSGAGFGELKLATRKDLLVQIGIL
ncbi:hypothetical protein TNCV_4117541 [Trichonephila clavipes]|nr:hypothetical protein TNCV_4117541 [Trichonephila clavipes]